jgi:hypothetical protein
MHLKLLRPMLTEAHKGIFTQFHIRLVTHQEIIIIQFNLMFSNVMKRLTDLAPAVKNTYK